MIYPSQRLAVLMALGAPVALGLGVVLPRLWLLPLGWMAFLAALAAADLLLAPGRRAAVAELAAPGFGYVGERLAALCSLRFVRGPYPGVAEVALGADARVALEARGRLRLGLEGGAGEGRFWLELKRRGPAPLGPLDLRWRGPFGLVWRQRRFPLDAALTVAPDVRPVRQEAPRLIAEDAETGQQAQPSRGESLEFESLGPWRAGEDKRRIDWKHSARHMSLIAKETRVERDNAICLAVDCGRLMTAPIAGLARLDRAITAALLTGYVALKGGDRVGLYGFDRTPRALVPPLSGAGAFVQLQAAAGALDYAEAETNFTLGLSRLGQKLSRRTLILLFTDFTDPIGAELMVRATAPLLKRHRLMCVTMADSDLVAETERRPRVPEDIARAVTAASLLRERRIVFERLRRLGVEVVEAPHDRLGSALVRRYLDLKRRGPL